MKLTMEDLDRLEMQGVGGLTTYEEQMALIDLARKALKRNIRVNQSVGENTGTMVGLVID